MYYFRESRGPVRTVVSFSAADNNRHTTNNLAQLGRAPDHYASPNKYSVSFNNNFLRSSFPTGYCSGSGSGLSTKATKSKEIISFHSANKWKEYFQASKQSNKLVVIYFTATWCGPCRFTEPTIKDFAAKYSDVELVKIDVDELFNVSCEYGIQTMPTFLFMKNGKQINKVAGAKTGDLQRKIEKYRSS